MPRRPRHRIVKLRRTTKRRPARPPPRFGCRRLLCRPGRRRVPGQILADLHRRSRDFSGSAHRNPFGDGGRRQFPIAGDVADRFAPREGLVRVARPESRRQAAHLMEDLLQEVVGGTGRLTPKMVDALLTCTDGLRLRRRAKARQCFLGGVWRLCRGTACGQARDDRGARPGQRHGDRLRRAALRSTHGRGQDAARRDSRSE